MNGGKWRVEAMRSYGLDQLLWFTRGQGRMTVGGITRGYGPHNIVYIPAGTMHSFEVGPQVYGSALFFWKDHGLQLPDRPVHLRIRDGHDQVEMTALIENIQREVEGDRPARHRAIECHAGLLAIWLERQMLDQEDSLATITASRKLMQRYAEMVESRFHTHDSVIDYATALDVTSTHLTRVCKRTCGKTASEFLTDRKIAEARRLLADTTLPVKDIASGLGYASPAYFTRNFQSQTGKSPVAFRKSR